MTQVSEAQLKIAQDGDLEPLLKLLRHDDEKVRALAAKAVGNLDYYDEEVVLKDGNGYSPLLELVKHPDSQVRSKAVWTVAILASNEDNQADVIKYIGWDITMSLITDKVVEVQCGGVTLLGNLALLMENKISIINKGGIDVLVTLLKETRDVIVKRAIVTALSNIVDSDNAVEVIDEDGLDELLVLLDKSEDERLLSGIVHTLSNIANAESVKFNKRIARRSLDKLTHCLNSPVEVLQKGAVMVFNGLSSTKIHQAELFERSVVKTMLDLLQETKDEELVLGIILCLNNLTSNVDNHNELLEMGAQETLIELFEKSSDTDVKRECTEALNNLGGSNLTRSSKTKSKRRKKTTIRPDGTGVKDNVKQIIKMLIRDPTLQGKLQKLGVIPHLVSLIAADQKDENVKGLALDALTMLAMNNGFNQQSIALANNNAGILHIEEMIRDPYIKPQILLRAVRLLGTLCWKNRLIQDGISDKNIPRLVSLLDSFDNGLKKAALTAVACLAEGNVKNQLSLHKLRADKMVSQIIMHEPEPNSMVAAAAQAVASFCRENPKSQIVCNRAIGSLLHHLENSVRVPDGSEDHVVQEHLSDALLELTRNNKENKGILWRMHVVRLVIEILANVSASPVTHYNSLGVLWEYCKSDAKCKLLSGNQQLTRILGQLIDSDDSLVKDAAGRLKSKLNSSTKEGFFTF